jgi:glycogen debranching enzyme
MIFSLRACCLRGAVLFAAISMHGFGADSLQPIPKFPLPSSPIRIVRDVEAAKPFSVAGERGAIFGQQGGGEQSGGFEAWVWPVKVISGLQITAVMADYPVPIDVNGQPGSVEVNPDHTTITYSHAGFTVRQHMFSARGETAVAGTGPVVLFEFDSVRPLDLTFKFIPVVERMWPAPTFGRPNAEWVPRGDSGYYILHTNDDGLSGAVAMPRAKPGVLAPYQERPKFYPTELTLHFDPAKDSGLLFPLLIVTGSSNETLGKQLAALNAAVPQLFQSTKEHYDHLLASSLRVNSPDRTFDQALQWAVVSIDQSRVSHNGEVGLTAGYYSSADSARPGFGWFFGRDTLWTLYAVNTYGGKDLAREALEFIFKRQRDDGKVMHEYSQTAELLNWKATPYFYASADSTPLLVMACEDYFQSTGDLAFIRRHWDGIKKAYAFTRAHDSDRDGIYENTEGTGWVESWPGGMPHQEVYLAALDQQSAESIGRLAKLMAEPDLAQSAAKQAGLIRSKLESEYLDTKSQFYAFSRNPDGTLDTAATIYPSVVWWTGRLSLPKADAMLSRWAAPEFSTDWGARDVSGREKIFDPLSYHQGSVWPLFTGWVSLAEFHAGRPLAGAQHLWQNLGMTYTQDLGAVTELLSGAYFQPLGRSSSHQLWSSAMVLTPAVRGLLGLEVDAPNHTLRLSPNLPASWSGVRILNVPFGETQLDLDLERERGELVIRADSTAPVVACLVAASEPQRQKCNHPQAKESTLHLPLPGVEVELPHELPVPGAATRQMKVIDEERTAKGLSLTLLGQAGSTDTLHLRINGPKRVRVSGATMIGERVNVVFPAGSGYVEQRVKFEWRSSSGSNRAGEDRRLPDLGGLFKGVRKPDETGF